MVVPARLPTLNNRLLLPLVDAIRRETLGHNLLFLLVSDFRPLVSSWLISFNHAVVLDDDVYGSFHIP